MHNEKATTTNISYCKEHFEILYKVIIVTEKKLKFEDIETCCSQVLYEKGALNHLRKFT